MNLHQWDVTVEEAVALQRSLASQIQTENRCDPATIQTVAGLDASYKEEGNAAVVVLSYPDLTPVEQATAVAQSVFPYVPGLLSFRETPIALRAFEKLTSLPDVIMVDGQGIAHPRRFGIACHLGLLLDRPTIGVAKSRLVGTYEEPGNQPGDRSPLLYKGEIIGAVVRTRLRCNPLFISVGHQIDLETAVSLVLSCQKGYRLPEPIRQAHILAGTRTT